MGNKRYHVNGFSLVEMLVVLVIVASTSVLLSQGLTTTWRNFSKLSTSELSVDKAKLPMRWFADSVKSTLLSHPDRIMISGNAQRVEFVTFLSPNTMDKIPRPIRWTITQESNFWFLTFEDTLHNQLYNVYRSQIALEFIYLIQGQWVSTFPDAPGTLPRAIAITTAEGILVTGVVGRPVRADIPVELPVFGAYEFGS